MEYKLSNNISLKYIDCIRIDGVEYYKHRVDNLKTKSINSKMVYFDKQVSLENVDKNKLLNYITGLNDDNIFINLDNFVLNNTLKEKGKSGGSSSDGDSASRNSNKKNTGIMGFELLDQEKFDDARSLINNVNECGNIMMALINLNGHESLNGQNSGIANSITGFKAKINGLADGNGPTAFFYEYKSVYNDLLEGINIAVATQMLLLEENGYLKQNEESLAMFGNDAFSKEFRELMNGVVNGDITYNSIGELNNAIAALQSKYSLVTESDARTILGAASLTEDSEELKDMSKEEREEFIKNKNEQLDSIYNHLNETIGITRDAFDNMLKNNLDELAKMISDASIKSAESVKAGGDELNIMNDLIYSMQDSWYSTSAGQDALLNRFKDESITDFDEYDAIANTEYIKYCIMTGHTHNWLKDEFKKFANVVSKIDATGNFSIVTDNLSEEELDYVNSYVAATGFIPYGYVKVKEDGKNVYKRRDYTKQGQEILYYMDYHCGEDVIKNDEDKIITAFSNQGTLDAYERNYKGEWINSQLTGDYTSESQKQAAIESAERDYNILNGIIDDPDRKQQLIDEGYLSFEQLASFVNNNNIDLNKLSDKKYIEKNKAAIMEATGLNEAQIYNFAVTGTMPKTGVTILDGYLQLKAVRGSTAVISTIQLISGLGKFFENVGDAAKTAVNSDFFLNIGTTKDSIYGTTQYNNFSQNIEFTKEFNEYREKIWNEYLADETRYKQDFEQFSNEIDDEKLKQYISELLGPTVSQYALITSNSYVLSDNDRQKYLTKMFEETKMQEWSLNDSSSSNYYLATFKEGIRNGGDFSSFDKLDSYIIENATKQFDVINEVSIDNTGKFMNDNIYDNQLYKTLESFSIVKHDNILGMTANQIGNMVIPVALNVIPGVGTVLSSATLFTSAFGGSAEEAFVNGASYNEALGYATLSATTELVIEKLFSGIGGYGVGSFDNVIESVPNMIIDAAGLTDNVLAQSIKKLITGGIGEAAEEVATDFVTPLWQSLTYMNEKNFTEILKENFTLENEIQTALVSFLSSMVFGTGEIVNKNQQFNNQIESIINEIGDIPGFKEQANKVLADIIGYNGQYLTTEIITKVIENNAKEIELNPESATALKELQQNLSNAYQQLTENTVEIKTSNGSINISRELLMNIIDLSGLNQKNIFNRKDKVTIEENQVYFKDITSQNKFVSTLYNNARNVLESQIQQNRDAIKQYETALEMSERDKVKLEDINSAIQVIKELGDKSKFSEVFNLVTLEINGKDISIPISVVQEITNKYNIKDGKIEFTEEYMNSKEFINEMLSNAITLLSKQNNNLDVQVKLFKDSSTKGDVELLEVASNIIGNNLNTFIVNSTKVDGQNLIKLEVKTKVNGEYRNVNIYVDSSTNPTIYNHNELLNQKIQEVIDKNIGKENIYLGEMIYDKKNNEIIVNENRENNTFVENIKTSMNDANLSMYTYEYVDGNSKEKVNIYLDTQTDANVLQNNNVNKKINEIIAEKRKSNSDIKDIYVGKIELKDGQAKVTTERAQKAFVDSKTENIVTTQRNHVSGTNLIKVETYVTIDGKTEKVNVYIDSSSNTSLLSESNAKDKILDIIAEEKKNNKDTKDVYVGELLRDKKNGNIVANQNNTTLEQFRSVIIASAVTSNGASMASPTNVHRNTTSKSNKNADTNASSNTNVDVSKETHNSNINTNIDSSVYVEQESQNNQTIEQVADVIQVDKSTPRSSSLSFKRQSFDMNKTYQRYDYVVKPKTDLVTTIREIKNNLKTGNILIEIPNTLELTQEVIDELSDNMFVRITGGYTLDFLNDSKLKAAQTTGTATLEHTTYSKTELQNILNSINTIESQINLNWSKLEIAQFLYNYLKDNIAYNPNPHGGNAYRAKRYDGLLSLVEVDSTCQGFAYTYNALLQRYGISSYVISGALEGVGQHVFNVVEVDGNQFIVDTVREKLGSEKYTGTGFNPENISEYEFHTNTEVQENIAMNALNEIIQNPNLLDDIIKTGNYRGIAAETILEELKSNNQLSPEFNKKIQETYSSVPTATLRDFMKLNVDEIGKVIIEGNQYEGYDSETILKAIIEMYNDSTENGNYIKINSNLEHLIKEYQSINLQEGNQLFNLEDALYKKENIISLPTRVRVSSYRGVSVIDMFDIINGRIDISTTRYSEIDLYEATKELSKYFEGKNISISPLTKNAFDAVKSIDENNVIINFMDALNGKKKIVLPKEIQGKYGKSKINDVLEYLNGGTYYVGPGVIESLKEYIDTNNIQLSKEIMDKINLLASLGEDNILINEKAYLKGQSNPIIIPKYLEGIYTNTSKIYDWITGSSELYDSNSTEENIKLTKKFAEYIYSNNIILEDVTMSKLEILKTLKENETILNLQEFFKGESATIIDNNISMNGNNFKVSTILDVVNLKASTYLKVLSGQNIDGITRENIFEAIEVLYYVNPSLKEVTLENYEKIKSIYNNNFVLDGTYVLPKTFNNVSCEFIEMILKKPMLIRECTIDERTTIFNAIDEYINYLGENHGKYYTYDTKVKLKNNLIELANRQIPAINLTENIYSLLYQLFLNVSENGGTFGTDQGVIREMLKEVGMKDMVKALFHNKNITDDNFLTDLSQLGNTKEKLIQALNNLFNNPNRKSAERLINFIKNNKEIKLVQKNFPGMNGIDVIRFLYLVETVEAGNNGVCNYAAAVNMIFNRYIGKEVEFEKTFGYPMYITNSQGKKILNDSMLLVDMYSTINKGVLVKEVNGKYEIATTNNAYLNLSDVGRFEMEYLQKFIDTKGIDLGLNETFYYSSLENAMWKEEIILKVKESLEKGEYINISGAGFDLLRKDGSIACKDCGGHIMTVVGLTTDGKIIVDSWGQELFIELETTINNLGEEVKIDGREVERRLAITSYELIDASTNIENKSKSSSIAQELETFDTSKEIDMIDESNIFTTQTTENTQMKAPRPQMQTENIKQLSILDNIKHTLVKLNDKFTGFKMSKLTTESYYERTTKSNNKLFKQKQINKTFRDFANRHLIDLEILKENGLLRNPMISEINSLITNNRVLSNMEDANVSIADILGTKKNVDLDKNFGLLFNEGAGEFQTRDLGLLEYSNDQILNVLAESFKNHPIIISEVDTGKYIIEDNGYHRYSILRLHYLSEYIKVKDNPTLVGELNQKYTIPVKVYKLDTTKTYCTSLLKELGMNIEVKTKGFKKTSNIFIDGKKVTMSDSELIEFTKNKINSDTNYIEIINRLLSESESFKEFYNEFLTTESNDYGIDFNIETFKENTQIEVNNKTYSLDTIIEILNNKYLEILKGRTIDGINSQNLFGIVNKVFESNPEIKNKYQNNYDSIVDIFKTKYVHENGNLYQKAFNFIKTQDIIEILKQPYKLQRYSKEKRIQINEAINMYVEYAISNNYDLTPKEYKGYSNVTSLMSRDVPNVKLTSEVGSELLNEFRRNVLNKGTFGSKQGVIRALLERNGITDAINYLFNKDAKGTKFLEQIQDFTDEDFQDLLDNAVDETGRLDGLYNLYDEFELFELMRNNFDGIEDLEIIKFLYLFESTEAGAKGICNYSVAVNMIFNKYLGNETQFKKDFGYPMYVIKDGKKVFNDTMLLVDMYSTINEEVFTREVDGVVKVVATNNKNYLPVTNPGGSFNIENLNKFLNKKGIKLDLNKTFAFDSRTDAMWKEEILSNVKRALEKGETVNLSAQGFNLYRKDGKTLAAEDFEGHAMTVVGLTKEGNLIVDSHGMEMIVNLDLCLENAGKVYLDKNKNIKTRRIGIATYSFDSSVLASNQDMNIIDVSDSLVNKEIDEGILDVFSKPSGDIDLFKEILSNNQLDTLTDLEITSLIENINKGKIKPKDYNLTPETIHILIDKVPLKKIFPLSNVTAVKSFIDYFGIDTLVEFDKLNNGFLFGNKGENLYSLFDFYDLSIPKTNATDKLKEFNNLIRDTLNSNKKTEHKTYTFNYSGLIGSEFSKTHPELFLDESAPQDLKDAFYNGLVNSGNEYKIEWSPYLEGKSIKGIKHKPLVSFEDVKIVEKINTIGENSTKYHEGLIELANKVGMTTIEVEEILNSKLIKLIETSEFGVRRTLKSLESILESGKLKNQFEVNYSSYGVSNTDMRMDMEKELFGIPRNLKYEDRPIYGMLLPENLNSKYVHKGPGAYYSDGSGVIYIFDKSKIMNNATLTLGDSIDQASKICATNLSNPRYFGMFSEMLSTIKTKEDLLNFEFTSLYDKTVMEVGNSAYYEFQLHGKESHTLDNLKEIVFLKEPEAKIIKKLEEKNIKWRVIGQDSSKKNNSPSIKKDKVIKDNKDGYFTFDNKKAKPIKELSDYYGDAGKRVNSLFLEGKTTSEVLEELSIFEKNKFKKFLEETIQGRYLAKLTDDEITALTLYTKDHFSEINFVLRHNNKLDSIAGRNPEMLIENIDSAISKYGGLEQSMKIYRAVDVRAFTHQNATYKELFKGIKVYNMKEVYAVLKTLEGKEFSDLGYMSSSPAYGTSFAKHLRYSIILEIAAPKGTECAYINQLSSFYNAENEILLARNTKLQMVEVLEPEEDIFNYTKVVVRCIVKE